MTAALQRVEVAPIFAARQVTKIVATRTASRRRRSLALA